MSSEEEKANAIEKGYSADNGIPYVTVYENGGWLKRSQFQFIIGNTLIIFFFIYRYISYFTCLCRNSYITSTVNVQLRIYNTTSFHLHATSSALSLYIAYPSVTIKFSGYKKYPTFHRYQITTSNN